uniref:BRCT domain-containing protein n=2 Tax=Caenorhabditis japonica TaxID=281687 RepID=A0A8R1DEL7_CAEJA
MKRTAIIMFAVLLFFNPILSVSSSPNMSSFSLLVDDLSIVARISNAIALQKEVMKNSTDIKQIIRELIPAQYDFLPLIQRVNVSGAIEILDWLSKEVTGMKTYKERMTEGELEEALLLTNFLSLNSERLTELKAYNELTAQNFYSALNDSGTPKIYKFCDNQILDLVSSFYRLLKYERPEQSHNILSLFRNLSSDQQVLNMRECYKNLEKFPEMYKKSSLYTSLNEMVQLRKLKSVAKTFVQKSRRHSSVGNISETVEKFMGKMKGIWSKLPLNFNSTDVNRLMNLYSKLWNHIILRREPKIMTAGFILPMDTIKVKEDLESSFFKNIVAGKKDVKRLTRALNFFLKFAAESAKLENAFANSVNFIKDHMSGIEQMNKTVNVFLSFNAENISTRISELTKSAIECSKKVTDDTLLKNGFSKFEDAYNQVISVQEVLQIVRIASGTMKYKDPEFLANVINDFKKEQNNLDEYNINDWLMSYKIREDYNFLEDAAESLFNLNHAVSSLDIRINQFKNRQLQMSDFSVKREIAYLSLFPVLECYKEKAFNFDLFRQTTIFLLNVVNFTDYRTINATKSFFNHIKNIQDAQNNVYKVMEKEKADVPESRVLYEFKNSMDLSQRFGKGVMALRDIRNVLKNQNVLLDLANISETGNVVLQWDYYDIIKLIFNHRNETMRQLQNSLSSLEKAANLSVSTNLSNFKPIFDAAQKVIGFNVTKAQIIKAVELLDKTAQFEDSRIFKELSQLNLNFESFGNSLGSAAVSAQLLNDQFDFFFGLRTENSILVFIKELSATAIVLITLSFICVLVLLSCTCLIGYGFTKSGRARYKTYWLYYFGKPEDFEKRWRYALFMDTVEGTNVVIDCAREVNPVNLKKALVRGAYVNVYSQFGNTALHTATKRGFPEIVQILITHGADRSLLNYQNKTAEQMLPKENDYEAMEVKVANRYRETAQVYQRLCKKKYRIRVPQEFPVSSYHIFMESRTNDELTDMFMDKFQHITSNEALPTTTHCICHTTTDGVLETNDFEVLQWIFRGVIIVKEQWMTDCLQNPILIENDEKYLIHDVKYNDVLYKNAVLPWTMAMAKGTMPYLQGVYLLVVMQECPYFLTLATLIPKLGAVLLPAMPSKETFNKGSHPYLHAHENPVWILHDNSFDLTEYENDADHLFFTISEKEFIALLLKREIDQDMSQEPIPVVTVEDGFF